MTRCDATPAHVRAQLIDTLRLDRIGPRSNDRSPSNQSLPVTAVLTLATCFSLWCVGVVTGPCIKLRVADTAATQLGEAAFESLGRSGAIVPHPEDWDNLPLSPVLATAGVKNWSTFSRCATCLEIDVRGDKLLLTPMHYEGRLNYTSTDDPLHLPSTASAAELGQAIQQALALCR